MDWPCFETRWTFEVLHEIIEGRMRGKPTRRIQMLHDLANDDGFVALKRAASLRTGRYRDTEKG